MNTISFPNMFNVNNAKLSTNLSYNTKSIHESLKSLILVNPGELLGDPAYGCGIRRELFNIKSNINVNELKNTIVRAINKYIPQIIVSKHSVKIYSDSNSNHYKIVIYYTTSTTSKNESFELIL